MVQSSAQSIDARHHVLLISASVIYSSHQFGLVLPTGNYYGGGCDVSPKVLVNEIFFFFFLFLFFVG